MFPVNLLNSAGYVTACTMLAYISGEALIKSGIVAACIGAIVALACEGLRTMVALRRQRLDEFVAAERRGDELHAQESEFLRSQIRYLEERDNATRQRNHAIVAELQKAIFQIRDYEGQRITTIPVAPFEFKSLEEINAKYPLPDPPLPPDGV